MRCPDIRLGRKPVSNKSLFDLRQYLGNIPVIEAENSKTVKRNLVDEIDKSLPDLRNPASVIIQMVGINVRDHGYGRRKLQKRAVRLICLCHEKLSLTKFGIGPQCVQLSA